MRFNKIDKASASSHTRYVLHWLEFDTKLRCVGYWLGSPKTILIISYSEAPANFSPRRLVSRTLIKAILHKFVKYVLLIITKVVIILPLQAGRQDLAVGHASQWERYEATPAGSPTRHEPIGPGSSHRADCYSRCLWTAFRGGPSGPCYSRTGRSRRHTFDAAAGKSTTKKGQICKTFAKRKTQKQSTSNARGATRV